MKITRKRFLAAGGGALLAVARLPGAAKRWAMVIDLGKCHKLDGCTKCIDACHRAHNVAQIRDRAREVKWVWKEPFEHVFPQQADTPLAGKPALVTCNHCDQPPCVRVCPTGATWKRDDGIVAMDWHRCIGCRYCVAACPYGSRSFNWSDPRPHVPVLNGGYPTRSKGVVEKCTFCEERLAKGQLPACVEVCPEKAITFGDFRELQPILRQRFNLRRKPELGTRPQIFYIV
jgi:molybdopterin-containing oxidoreductase family iron-sulfur binding subunit